MQILGGGKTCSFDSTHYRINIITEDQPGGNPETTETQKCTGIFYFLLRTSIVESLFSIVIYFGPSF